MTFRESRQGFINECGYLVVHNSDIDWLWGKEGTDFKGRRLFDMDDSAVGE